nr:MAG TPA: hypothetical protein [Caudoviricetes sp.]
MSGFSFRKFLSAKNKVFFNRNYCSLINYFSLDCFKNFYQSIKICLILKRVCTSCN